MPGGYKAGRKAGRFGGPLRGPLRGPPVRSPRLIEVPAVARLDATAVPYAIPEGVLNARTDRLRHPQQAPDARADATAVPLRGPRRRAERTD